MDDAYQAKIQNDKIDLAQYRAVVAGDVIHEKLADKIVADATRSGQQRQVTEIYFGAADPAARDAIKVRHILYSPKDDPSGAANVAATDPAWETAQGPRDVRPPAGRSGPVRLDRTGRERRGLGQGPGGTGGKLPYFDSTCRSIPNSSRRSSPGLKPGDLLPPVKSAFGWQSSRS